MKRRRFFSAIMLAAAVFLFVNCGQVIGQWGQAADQGAQTPDQGGQAADQGSQTPDQGGQMPDQGSQASPSSGSYAVMTAPGIKNGRVTANPARAAVGKTVTLTVSPASGYTLIADSLAVSGASGTVSAAGSGNIWTFTMPAGPVTVTAAFEALPAGSFSITTAALPAAGGVIAAALNAAAGETVTLELKANPAYTLSGAPLVTYGEGETVTVSGSGAYYTFTMPAAAVTVTAEFAAENAGGQEPGTGNALTADVSYVPTNDDVLWLGSAWTGYGTAAETWGLSVTEMPVVYFSVSKTAAQTVTAGGTDGGLVERAPPGAIWDGAEAGATLAVFRVNANKLYNGKEPGDVYDEWYDSMFEGDDFQFTLNVGEDGKEGKTVTVNLRQNVDLTKAAVFTVTGTGNDRTLTRQTGMKRYNGISNLGLNSHQVSFNENTPGTRLLDMLVWIDHELNTPSNNSVEYLVRVAADEEAIPGLWITYRHYVGGFSIGDEPAGKIRLRGAGTTEHVIKHDGTGRPNMYAKYYGMYDPNTCEAIGGELVSTNLRASIGFAHGGTLQLEKNITIKGSSMDKAAEGSLIFIRQAHLIMKEGATLRDLASSPGVYMYQVNKDKVWTRFTMEGGTIANIKGMYSPIFTTGSIFYKGCFTKTGGTLSNNKNNSDVIVSRIYYGLPTSYEEIGDVYPDS